MASSLTSIAAPQGPGTALIYNDWYPALRSESLQGQKLTTAMLVGFPLVLGRRSYGRLLREREIRQIRGLPLSCGGFGGEGLPAKYPVWAIEPFSGQCKEIPA